MDLFEKAAILHYHRQRIKMPGLDPLGWRSVESQQRRFEALCGVGDLSGLKVLDLGCGYGDLKPFLDQRFPDVSYLGVDHMPEFVDEARLRYGHLPKTEFIQADFLSAAFPEVDYILASGALNYRSGDPSFPHEIIRRMWAACRCGLGFNLLDANVFEEDYLLRGRQPEVVHAFCRGLDPQASLASGYLPDDFTILMRR
jgi:SAM-dependent methyltransferase